MRHEGAFARDHRYALVMACARFVNAILQQLCSHAMPFISALETHEDAMDEQITGCLHRPVGVFAGHVLEHALVTAGFGHDRLDAQSLGVICAEPGDLVAQFQMFGHVLVAAHAVIGNIVRGQVDNSDICILVHAFPPERISAQSIT
jgi:hypothetical protein